MDFEFNPEVMHATRIYKEVICAYENDAHSAFGRARALQAKTVEKYYPELKKEREQALSSQTGSPIDATDGDAYKILSENRRLALESALDPLNGNSPLEAHLPKNSAFRSLLEPQLGSIRDVRTGLNAHLERRDGKPPGSPDRYILAFPGTGVVNTAGAQWKTNIRQFLGIGGMPKMYQQAVELAQELQKNLPKGCKLEVCGHSLGGGIATCVGLMMGIPAVGLNSAPLGRACLKVLRKANALTPDRVNKITHIRTEGDPVTSRTVNHLLTRMIYGDAGFFSHAPKLVGKVYTISQQNISAPMREQHTMNGFGKAYSRTEEA